MSFVAAGLEGPSSTSSPYSAEASSLPSQLVPHLPVIDLHPVPLAHGPPSHSQLELQHQHFQAQLQLHHLQSQKQRQLNNATLVHQHQPHPSQQQSLHPSVAASLPTTAFTQQSFTVLNPSGIPATSNFVSHPPPTSTSDPNRSYLGSVNIAPTTTTTTTTAFAPSTATVADASAALSPMDILSATPFPEPSLNHSHPYQQQPYVYRTFAQPSSSPSNGQQQSQPPPSAIAQHSHPNNAQGHGAPPPPAASVVSIGNASSSQHQPLQYSMASSNGAALFANDDFLRRASQSSVGSDVSQRILDTRVKLEHTFSAPTSGYKLDARIIQKKDQIEELSTPGYKAPARSVEEVRTGQQFLIKLQFLRTDGSHATEFPTMRLERRNAINTSGEPVSEPEPLTLEIVVRLEKSGQVRRGACAKCCHKYGPASPILLLLDPLSPSPTDPAMYSHIDIYTGSLTLLAKVICSSTDHSERGNKDKYIFEFRVKRATAPNGMRSSLSPSLGEGADEMGEVLASCVTTPVMCSGHHKAKRLLVDQRVEKAHRGAPTPKTKVIKHRKSVEEGSMSPPHIVADSDSPLEQQHMSTTPAPMAYSPSTYPATSFGMSPSMLDTRMIGQDNPSPSSAQSLFPVLPDNSRTSPLPQHHHHHHDYTAAASHLGSTLVSSSSSTAAGLSSTTMMPPSPSIAEIRPNQGPIRKVTHVAIRGLSFREGMVPYFGCFPATDIVVETSTLLLCRAPESPLPGTVPVTICEGVNTSYTNLSEFTYTDDNETELLILQLQLRMAHRALEYLHAQATGQQGSASDILQSIPAQLSPSPSSNGGNGGGMMHSAQGDDASSPPSDEEHRSSTPSTNQSSSNRRPLTLEQVEQGLLKTVEHLPMAIDISMQLEDGSNLLHLSILMGFTKLALELIHLGCEMEVRDQWGYTPLMYAVFGGQVQVAQALVQAGATASGAQTPDEFYAGLGRPVEKTREMLALLATACGRYQSEEYCQWLPGLAHPPFAQSGEIESQESQDHRVKAVQPLSLPLLQNAGQVDEHGVLSPRLVTSSQLADESDDSPSKLADVSDEATAAAEQQESGYHSGVISEVHDRLKEMHRQQLPGQGVDMVVTLRRFETSSAMLASSSSSAMIAQAVAATLDSSSSSSSSAPKGVVSSGMVSMSSFSSSRATESVVPRDNSPFRTGDYFAFDIELTVNPVLAEGLVLPSSYLGLRFPQELVKRISGKAPSLLDEMTYDLKCSIELGPHGATAEERAERILVTGACKECNKWLHEQGRLSPTRSLVKHVDWSPVLQFGIPMSQDHHHHHQQLQQQQQQAGQTGSTTTSPLGGVVEVRQGRCEVKGRVHCSSMHHLVQREKERFLAIKREREQTMMRLQEEGSSEYDPQWKSKLQAEANRTIKELQDPGYVFVFELVHPLTKEVVTTARTEPMVFRTFQRRK